MSIVEVSELNKRYDQFRLKDVSFKLETGKITGFIGRNGAGKSTTIKAMLNLIHLDSGQVSYFGLPLRGHENEIKQRIGYSTGTISWYPRKTIAEIVNVSKNFYQHWDEHAYRRYLQLFALNEQQKPIELSAGMKVKFNLLLALSHQAQVLILDEPTSGLDPFSREEFLDILLMLKRDGVTTFFSTHITSDLEKCADKIIYISNGEIKAESEKTKFICTYGTENETLEQIILRLEREARV